MSLNKRLTVQKLCISICLLSTILFSNNLTNIEKESGHFIKACHFFMVVNNVMNYQCIMDCQHLRGVFGVICAMWFYGSRKIFFSLKN